MISVLEGLFRALILACEHSELEPFREGLELVLLSD